MTGLILYEWSCTLASTALVGLAWHTHISLGVTAILARTMSNGYVSDTAVVPAREPANRRGTGGRGLGIQVNTIRRGEERRFLNFNKVLRYPDSTQQKSFNNWHELLSHMRGVCCTGPKVIIIFIYLYLCI